MIADQELSDRNGNLTEHGNTFNIVCSTDIHVI